MRYFAGIWGCAEKYILNKKYTPKYEMDPLNVTMIQQRYQNVFSIDSDEAAEI